MSITVAVASIYCGSASREPTFDHTVGKCETRWYNGSSEDPRCYELQEQLATAVLDGDIPKIKETLGNGANVNGGYAQSSSVLWLAAFKGRNDVVKLLIDSGADVNKRIGLGNTALTSAVSYGHKETVEVLIDNGAYVCEGGEGSPLDLAVKSHNSEIVDVLINARTKNCLSEAN